MRHRYLLSKFMKSPGLAKHTAYYITPPAPTGRTSVMFVVSLHSAAWNGTSQWKRIVEKCSVMAKCETFPCGSSNNATRERAIDTENGPNNQFVPRWWLKKHLPEIIGSQIGHVMSCNYLQKPYPFISKKYGCCFYILFSRINVFSPSLMQHRAIFRDLFVQVFWNFCCGSVTPEKVWSGPRFRPVWNDFFLFVFFVKCMASHTVKK